MEAKITRLDVGYKNGRPYLCSAVTYGVSPTSTNRAQAPSQWFASISVP